MSKEWRRKKISKVADNFCFHWFLDVKILLNAGVGVCQKKRNVNTRSQFGFYRLFCLPPLPQRFDPWLWLLPNNAGSHLGIKMFFFIFKYISSIFSSIFFKYFSSIFQVFFKYFFTKQCWLTFGNQNVFLRLQVL